MGSPPPAVSKKDVLKFRSVNIIVIALASTGRDNSRRAAVVTIAHPYNAILCNQIPGVLILNVVVMKFIAPNKELIPDKCRANIAKSTLGPL